MNIGFVIVDAYSDRCEDLDLNQNPHFKFPKWTNKIKENVKHFSGYLTYVCDYERSQGTSIIHSFGDNKKELYDIGRENVARLSQLRIGEGDIIASSENLAEVIIREKLNMVFYGGFHFGKCIHSHSNRTYQNLRRKGRGDIDNLNLVLNLSMTTFDHSWKHHINAKRGWDINLSNENVRNEIEASNYVGKELLPTHTQKQLFVNEILTEVNYNHHMWSMNGFEEINVKGR